MRDKLTELRELRACRWCAYHLIITVFMGVTGMIQESSEVVIKNA